MSESRVFAGVIILAICWSCGGPARPSKPPLGENLIPQPGAELDGEDDALEEWTDTGCLRALKYGSDSRIGADDPGPADRGDYFFGAEGLACRDTVIGTVSIDGVDRYGEDGIVKPSVLDFEMRAWLGGSDKQSDWVTLSAWFLGADDRVLRVAQLGPVTAEQRDNQTQMLERTVSDSVPGKTREILIELRFLRPGPGEHDGYADNLAFVLEKSESK